MKALIYYLLQTLFSRKKERMPTTGSFLRESGLHHCGDCRAETTYDLLLQTEMFGKSKQENKIPFLLQCTYPALHWTEVMT